MALLFSLVSRSGRTSSLKVISSIQKKAPVILSNRWISNDLEKMKDLGEVAFLITSMNQLGLTAIKPNFGLCSKYYSNDKQDTAIKNLWRLPTTEKSWNIIYDSPLYNPKIIHNPNISEVEKFDPASNIAAIEEPSPIIRKEAARLIMIRRRKMRRHKLRKLRKKMKYVWLKAIQKKEYAKEKLFQSTQMEKIYKAEAFSAETFVKEFIAKTKEKPLPKTWKGRRLPADVIRNIIENGGKYKHTSS